MPSPSPSGGRSVTLRPARRASSTISATRARGSILSGSPSALNDAITSTGFDGRVVIGSWYGEKQAMLDLGGEFHRSRIKLISSQVSTIAPKLSGRWDKGRRFQVAWDALERVRPGKLITHRFSLGDAKEAYWLLDKNPEETIQIILQYGHEI